jgi:hypothetical protein
MSQPNLKRSNRKILSRLGYTSILAGAMVLSGAIGAMGQSYQAKYAGSSTLWRPQYAGTIELQSKGMMTYTAVMDVELQRLPNQDDLNQHPTAFNYEMRGQVTLTSPYRYADGQFSQTCNRGEVNHIEIGGSGLRLYTKDAPAPTSNTYSLQIDGHFLPLDCTDGAGRPVTLNAWQKTEIRFDTTTLDADFDRRVPPPNWSKAEIASFEQSGAAAQAMVETPEFQQSIAQVKAIEQFVADRVKQTGKPPTPEEMMAAVQRLMPKGSVKPPTIDPGIQQKMQRYEQLVRQQKDSQLLKLVDPDRLHDRAEHRNGDGTLNASWDLRRVNSD